MKKLASIYFTVFLLAMLGLSSCTTGPQKIKVGEDACSFCKMSIADNRFGAEIITKKGKVYKFDDTHCLTGFHESNTINNEDIKNVYLVDFNAPHDLIPSEQIFLLKSSQLRSPMGGNVAAFSSEPQLKAATAKFAGEQLTMEGILK
ncbi:copper chaperone NosL [Pedobacter sp. CAN_A7]|uniref:nitrous oxide reductase accessory protein NosL n=1 Tax=Pedobacter sp. CAN_A7 TaxID=2787722 RepID=UPI0018C92E46